MTRPTPPQVFAKRWWLLLVCAVIGAGLAALYSTHQHARYESDAALVASPGPNSQSDQYVLQRVPTYPLILSSNVLLQKVAGDLGNGYTAADVAAAVSASNPPNTAVVDIIVRTDSADRSYAIADALVKEALPTLNGLETNRVIVSAIMSPDRSQVSTVPNHRTLDLLVGVVIGLVIGGGSSLLFERLRYNRSNRAVNWPVGPSAADEPAVDGTIETASEGEPAKQKS